MEGHVNCTCLWRLSECFLARRPLLSLSPEASGQQTGHSEATFLNPVCRWTPVVVLNPERLGTWRQQREERVRLDCYYRSHVWSSSFSSCVEARTTVVPSSCRVQSCSRDSSSCCTSSWNFHLFNKSFCKATLTR